MLNPYEYAVTVKRLGNNVNVLAANLEDVLPNNSIMAINIMSSTSSGKDMNAATLRKVIQACDDVINLNNQKLELLSYIENRMKLIAPNLSELLGVNIAAKLVTAAGGIIELSKMPACNVLVIGAQRQNLEGFSTAGKLHRGYLAELEEVKLTPNDFKNQALRRFASKAVLAARIDAYRKFNTTTDEFSLSNKNNNKVQIKNLIEVGTDSSKDNMTEKEQVQQLEKTSVSSDGERLKELISKKMNKIQEPQQAKLKKALPKPDDKPRRKRGGKRMRSIKQRYELTEMRQAKNRMKFGTEGEIEYRESGKGYGMLGVGGTGSKIKMAQKVQKINTKKQKMLALESNKDENKLGMHSSVVFTPVEGIELINPDLLQKRLNNASEKYFSSTSGFSTVINQKRKGQNSLFEI